MIGFIINIMKEGMRMNQDNILVVEDEIEIAKAIEIYLKSQGYNVYIANNGKAGLEMVERYGIHLAIVDIMMPVMDGIETVSYTHLDVYKRQVLNIVHIVINHLDRAP